MHGQYHARNGTRCLFGIFKILKVLIVKLSAFGDIIHALPALDDLLARPEIDEVHWLVDQRFAFVTDVFPVQVKVHKVALKGESKIRHAWQMIKELRQENFDIIFDLQGLIKSGIMAWASAKSGCKIFGFDREQSPEWPNRYCVTPVAFHPDELHVVQKYRHITAAPFTSKPTPLSYKEPHIPYPPTASTLPLSLTKPYTVVHVGGGWETKQLPHNTWHQCISSLEQHHTQVIVTWGNSDEQQRAKNITKDTSALVLPTRLDMPHLCKLLQQSQAVIGMDTGVLHLAAALAAPTVTLWGPSASWNAAALGVRHRHVESNPKCGPCFKRQCDEFICLPSLTPQQIIQAWLDVKT